MTNKTLRASTSKRLLTRGRCQTDSAIRQLKSSPSRHLSERTISAKSVAESSGQMKAPRRYALAVIVATESGRPSLEMMSFSTSQELIAAASSMFEAVCDPAKGLHQASSIPVNRKKWR